MKEDWEFYPSIEDWRKLYQQAKQQALLNDPKALLAIASNWAQIHEVIGDENE